MRKLVSPILIFLIVLPMCAVFMPKVSASSGPVISSVSAITATRLQTITITGSGFGNTWPQTYGLGDGSVDTLSSANPYMCVSDNGKYQRTGDSSDGGDNWAAGIICPGCFAMVGIILLSWHDTEIILGGFGTALGVGHGTWYITNGDPITITIWTSSGRDAYTVIVPPPSVIHDVAVDSVVPLQTDVAAGDIVSVNVVTKNMGTQTETFSVTGHFGSGKIGFDMKTVTLNAGATQTLNMMWNTAGTMPGIYQIGAYASPVPGETNLSNNDCTDGTVTVDASTRWNLAEDSYSQSNYASTWSNIGNCYGLSSTEILYFMKYKLKESEYPCFPSQDPEALLTSDLKFPANTYSALNNAALAVMYHEVYDPNAIYHYSSSIPIPVESVEFAKLVSALESGTPAVMSMRCSEGAHSVVAYAIQPLGDGTMSIAVADSFFPQQYRTANYNPSTQVFSYVAVRPSITYHFFEFEVNVPGMIETSWIPASYTYTPSLQSWQWQVTGYDIVLASKPITVEHIIPGAGGSMPQFLMDYFSTPGDSGSFHCEISRSAGIEEGTLQVYAIPSTTSFDIIDPAAYQSTIMITRVENDSGQLVYLEYLLNTTAYGPLNYTVTPFSSGLSIKAGINGLNASVTFFSATQQDHSIFQCASAQLGPMQEVNFTVSDWHLLNDTNHSPITETTSDIAVTGVSPYGNWTYSGRSISVNVTVTNIGDYAENVTVSLFYNGAVGNGFIGSEDVPLAPNETETLTFIWNTMGVPICYSGYNITALADISPEIDSNMTNNVLQSTLSIQVRILGDINGDGKINLGDVFQVALAFGAVPEDSKWIPDADINGDGKINLIDFYIVCLNFGKSSS